MDQTPENASSAGAAGSETVPRKRFRDWLVPRRGRWHWALLRMAVAACLLILFRFQVLTWLTAGHNAVWKIATHSTPNNPADIGYLMRLRGPGLRMLVRIGEASALEDVTDASMISALLETSRRNTDPRVRASALKGLKNFWDARVLPAFSSALTDDDSAVRRAAIQGIATLGDSKHVPWLQRLAEQEREPAVTALARHTISSLEQADHTSSSASGPTVKVAAVQAMSEMGKPEQNRKTLEALVREAARNGAKIVVLPETAITGYMSYDLKTTWQMNGLRLTEGLRGKSLQGLAESVPGPSTTAFSALARELGIYLSAPFAEVDATAGRYFNTLVLFGPDGKQLLHYRKLNPWPYAERGWAANGDRGHQYVDTPYGRLGLLICYDINFEPPRLKRAKVDTLLYSIAWVDRPASTWFHVQLPNIARENDMNIVGANWTVPENPSWDGYGHSLIIERTGRVLARVTKDIGEEIIYAELPIPGQSAHDTRSPKPE